jgi:hypothetical protein
MRRAAVVGRDGPAPPQPAATLGARRSAFTHRFRMGSQRPARPCRPSCCIRRAGPGVARSTPSRPDLPRRIRSPQLSLSCWPGRPQRSAGGHHKPAQDPPDRPGSRQDHRAGRPPVDAENAKCERGVMEKSSLTAIAREQLRMAGQAASGRCAETVYGGHEHVPAPDRDRVEGRSRARRTRKPGRGHRACLARAGSPERQWPLLMGGIARRPAGYPTSPALPGCAGGLCRAAHGCQGRS